MERKRNARGSDSPIRALRMLLTCESPLYIAVTTTIKATVFGWEPDITTAAADV